MKEIVADSSLVALCGLYCGACGQYRKNRCPGCRKNEKATWCKIRICCFEHSYASCAYCTTFSDPMQCKKFNNFMSKLFSFLFKSDRAACIEQIRSTGIDTHAQKMAASGMQSIRKQA